MKIELDAKELVALVELLTQRNTTENALTELADKVSEQLAQQISDCLKSRDIS